MGTINKGSLLLIIIIAGGTGANLIKEFFGLKTDPLSAAWLSYNIWYMLYGAAIIAAIMWKSPQREKNLTDTNVEKTAPIK